MNYGQRAHAEDEYDRIRGFLRAEADASDAIIRSAFHAAAEGLMGWRAPGQLSAQEYRRLEGIREPYDWATDDNERGTR